MQELGEFTLKVSVMLNEIEKYMGFTINDKLIFIDSFIDNFFLRQLGQKFKQR